MGDFLCTEKGAKDLPVKMASTKPKIKWEWKPGCEPNEAASRLKMQAILDDFGAARGKDGKRGSIMIACGFACGEPCCCGQHISKHISGQAADLDRASIHALERKLPTGKTVEDLLSEFGLCRPLLLNPDSPEEWHVEAQKPHPFPQPKTDSYYCQAHVQRCWEANQLEQCPWAPQGVS